MLGLKDAHALASLDSVAEIPSMETFIGTAVELRNGKTSECANAFYLHVCSNGLDTYEALGNCVLRTFVDCRDVFCAQKVFNKLNRHDEFSWTSLIRGHAEYGDPQEAINLFYKMQDNNVYPSMFTFFSVLKACVNSESLERGQGLHIEVTRRGWDMEVGVGNSLMDMYSKCAALAEAQDTFGRLSAQDVVLWTRLLLGYVDCGLGEMALECFKEMQKEGVVPDAAAYVCSLKACGSTGAIDKGRKLYGDIIKGGFERVPFIGNALVATYVKCGLPLEAHEIFNRLPSPDVVSWNSLINGYADHGYCEDALDFLDNMRANTVALTPITYVGGLKACYGIGAIHKGQELHAQIVEEGFEHNQSIGNSLLGMYADCGLLLEARDIFDNLHIQDTVSWTSLIAGYAENNQERDALSCFERMQLEGILPEVPTYVSSLKACASLKSLNMGLKLHADIATDGFETDIIVSNTLIDLYTKCGSIAEAHEVFNSLLYRDVVSWNVLIAGCTDHGFGAEALNLLNLMQAEAISPNIVTYICGLKACAMVGALDKGLELYSEIVVEGYESNNAVGNTIVDMYLKCGVLVDAIGAFDELSIHDAVTCSVLLRGYAELGHCEAGLQIFEQMQLEGISPDINSWDAVILGFVEQSECEAVFRFYAQLQEQGLLPSMKTFVNILNACGSMAALRIGKKIHALVYRIGLEPTHVTLANALIDMYCSCGSMVEAHQLCEALVLKDVVTWNTIITGYSRLGESELVFNFLNRMRAECLEPGGITFLGALTVCNHAGLVEKGKIIFETVTSQYAIYSSSKHYHCMADLLGRAGHVDEAVAMLGKMPFKPDLVTWGTMLGACHKWGHVKLGTQAFENAVHLNQRHTASFISMSNMLAEVYTWED